MLRFSKNTHCQFLFFCVLAIFCFYQTTAAQSGRRIKKNDASSKQNAPVESKSIETEKEIQKDEAKVRISSLIVVGEVQHNFTYYNSNTIDIALKECVRMLQSSQKSVSQIAKGSGKLSYKEAKELAEKEAVVFVLWLGFSAKDDGYGNMYIESLQYAVLTPKTARIVTRGEIDPGENKIVTSSGGVLQVPTGRKSSATALLQMKQGAREIAAILIRGGWLD
jgi:hypothetical protein